MLFVNGLLSTEQLQEWLGVERPGAVLRFLREQGIAFFLRSGKPVTTLEAVNRVLLVDVHGEDFDVSSPPR